VKQILPIVLIKTVYEKNFIVVEAKMGMANAIKSCRFDETVQVVAEGCKAKIATLADNSVGYLE